MIESLFGYTTIEIGQAIAALYGIASVLARITPTPRDDKIVSAVGRFLNAIFLKSNIRVDTPEAPSPVPNTNTNEDIS